MKKCGQKLKTGKGKCHRYAQKGTNYCWQHRGGGQGSRKMISWGSDKLPKAGNWTVYGKRGCPYTNATKTLLGRLARDGVLGAKYVYHDITDYKEEAYRELGGRTKNYQGVPIIFNPSGRFIGGNDKLESCHGKSKNLASCR